MVLGKRRRFICDEEEYNIMRKIFKVTLEKDSTLEEESDENVDKHKLCRDYMVEVLKDRLSGLCDGNSEAEQPLPYLIGCYLRANGEEEENQIKLAIGMGFNYTQCCALNTISRQAKELIVSHSLMHLVDSVRLHNRDKDYDASLFLKTHGETNFRESYLLPLLYSKVCGKPFGGFHCPQGFLEQFIKDSDYDSLKLVLTPLYHDLRSKVAVEDLRPGNFEEPLKGLTYLVKTPICAKVLVNHPRWIPKVTDGIEFERLSILGGFFNVSLIPDERLSEKNEWCPRKVISCRLLTRRTNAKSSFSKEVRALTKILHDGLEEVLLSLLRNCETQENVFEYLSEIIRQNSSVTNIQVDPNCGSSGMFVNLSAVMLLLCKKFIDKDLTKRSEIDGTYLFCNPHLDVSDLTTVHASSKEVVAWISEFRKSDGSDLLSNSSEEATSSGSNVGLVSVLSTEKLTNSRGKTRYTIGCKFFFMTARVLHMGLVKSLSELLHLHRKLALNKNILPTLNALLGNAPFPQPEQDMEHLPFGVKKDWQKFCCYLSQILQDKALLKDALSFYRLMVVWLVSLVGGFKMPLPSSCPIEFACVPEHLVEDAIEVLIAVFTYSESLADVIPEMDEFLKFIIMFVASPNYIRNSYIRQRMVELLDLCIRNRRCSSSAITILEGSQLCVEFLVRNLLELYAGKEFIGSPNKLQFRKSILEVLDCLWEIPSHREIAEEDTGFYVVFLNAVISENIKLLDNDFHRILEETEDEMSSIEDMELVRFLQMQESALIFQFDKGMIGGSISYVIASVAMLAFTSKQIIVPFLLPHMVDIVVTMLNCFLLHLLSLHKRYCIPGRSMKCAHCVVILLKQIVSIYVHLARGDSEEIFAAAISKNSQSYNEQMFIDVARVLHEDSLVPEFIELGTRVNDAALKAIETETSLGEIPNEFLDPIEFKLMADPVILPSTKSVDRAVIQRHLLNYNTDPFNGLPLTQEILIPNVELKAKIERFIISKQSQE
ncbi:probable ubiquitin conjugation factor E4 isoform X2 [Papaver somniferum]|uniref:probable ubiquitin conjugation factor E4 isoform X2 n=1 Tax=Papaver somniferum TaxID=3469 RepID=UPI000E6F8F08|nr:probable ubiquitin conjugation factor E4 isoform X2 [Papaver somniferum]